MTYVQFINNDDLVNFTIEYDINVENYEDKTEEEQEDLLPYYYDYFISNKEEIMELFNIQEMTKIIEEKLIDLVEEPIIDDTEDLTFINGFVLIEESESIEDMASVCYWMDYTHELLLKDLSYDMYGSHMLEYDGTFYFVSED